MTAWATIRRFGVALALLAGVSVSSAQPKKPAPLQPNQPAKLTPAQLREQAEAAERAGDWELAFSSYCHLFVADRTAPEVREKLNAALRRVQQTRRHRDPGFVRYASGMSLGNGLDLFAEVVQKVPGAYVERDKATPRQLWASAIEELDRALGAPAFQRAFLDAPKPEKVEAFRAALRRDWAARAVTDFKEARTQLRNLIGEAQDAFAVRVPAALAVECAFGACSGLDEYTALVAPHVTEAAAVPDLSAAGVYLAYTKAELTVQLVAPGSWAAHHTALRRGDRITRINGRSTAGLGLPGIADALRSPVDGFHLLEVTVNDEAPLIARVPATVPTVYGSRPMHTKEIGYIRIGSFNTNTPRELDEAIAARKADGARVLVLDLRGNHGGSFLAGVETARRLLANGLIVTTQGQAAEVANAVFSSDTGAAAHDIPLVVLIDGETASAAEVVAAALKDNNRATLVGMPSFGKGSMQFPVKLTAFDETDANGKKINKTGTVRLTVARLIAPGGAYHGTGIAPHFPEADPTLQIELATEKALELLPQSMMRMMPAMPALPSQP
jgi:carboxyl-terminal processing protease